ncbi:MAG: hypothetical protein KIS79_00825 [Burkholderiales bacterium]|nr:hypothetical protein [Burkholderiales bacterium]
MRRRLWMVWAVLLVLIAVVFLLDSGEGGDGDPHGREMADDRRLLPAPIDELGAVEVAFEGNLHRFERDSTGLWFYHGVHAAADPEHGHATDPALAERIDKALIGFGRTRIERRIPLAEGAQKFGVTTPQMIVLVYLQGQLQPLAQYAVGDQAPDSFSRYVLRMGGSEIVTIANFHIDNLKDLIQAASAAGEAFVPPQAGS